MTTYVGLLYSIVIDKQRRVLMIDLRSIAEKLGYFNVRTLVATGNLVFEAEEQPVAAIESALEKAFAEFHGKHVDIIVRSAEDWRRLVAGNPYPEESIANPDQVVARIMRDPAEEKVADLFKPYQTAGEKVEIVEGDVWIAFPGQPSQSKLLGVLAPKRMGGIGTSRNWNTIRRLGEMVEQV
jgi:uncharacterized protein (DUF1697 family)